MAENLDELLASLSDEVMPEIDWAAPEAGAFPPQVKPGVYDFIFKLHEGDDGPWGSIEVEGKKYLNVIFDADVQVNGESKSVNFNRVSAYKHPKVALAGTSELMRSLNLRPASNPPSNKDIVDTFMGASGRARGKGEIAWRYYCKQCDVTVATSPRKRKNKSGNKVKDAAWPRNADGTFQDAVTCPQCGSAGMKQYGREEFTRFFSPATADAATAS